MCLTNRYGKPVCLFIILIGLVSCTKRETEFGLHKSQDQFIEPSIIKSQYEVPVTLMERNDSVALKLLPNLKKITWLEIDSTYIEELDLLTVSYGLVKDDKLSTYVVYEGKHLPLSVFLSTIWKDHKGFNFWIDLKNLNESNAQKVCEHVQKSFPEDIKSRLFIESPKANGLINLRKNGCTNLIYWLGGTKLGNMNFFKRILFQLKIYFLVRPSYVSQSYTVLENGETYLPLLPKAVWTNDIQNSHDSKVKVRQTIEELRSRSNLILLDKNILDDYL